MKKYLNYYQNDLRYILKLKLQKVYIWLPLPPRMKEVLKRSFFPILKRINIATRFSIDSKAIPDSKFIPDSKIFVNEFYPLPGQEIKTYVQNSKESLDPLKLSLRCIAFYLPQFHPIPENDQWWGQGFTEWTNVTKSKPQFVGHYQPHLPGDLGFYDLRLIENMYKQAALAQQYGLAGFCIYYYWFKGKRLLELPHLQILANPDFNMPFCLCWANENWTRRWDGQHEDVLIAQEYSKEDDIAMIADLASSFVDPRYIRVEGKPVFLVYRPMILPDLAATVTRWRSYCQQNGVGPIYLVAVESFELIDPISFGFDATCEFPPHQSRMGELNQNIELLNPNFKGKIFDYNELANSYIKKISSTFKRFSCVATSWDNEARLPSKGHIFINSNPISFARWLYHACTRTIEQLPEGERLIFINAWNEWAEGAHLEPDRKYGYGYLQSTAAILSQFKQLDIEIDHIFEASRSGFVRTSNTAIIFHLFYFDLLEEFISLLSNIKTEIDLFISVRKDLTLAEAIHLRKLLPKAYILTVANRGRDILPFFLLIPVVHTYSYDQICKLHTKRSPQLIDGNLWRTKLWNGLLDNNQVDRILNLFKSNSQIGLILTKESLINLNISEETNIDNRHWLRLLIPHIDQTRKQDDYDFGFPAGSMFWFRPTAMPTLNQLGLSENDFEPELGQLDGTLAHAIERLFILFAIKKGFSFFTVNSAEAFLSDTYLDASLEGRTK